MSASVRAILAVIVLAMVASIHADQALPASRAEAARLNNVGVALMNQQLPERAVTKFEEALRRDPSLATAELNKGIALLNMQKLADAQEALNRAAAADPRNPRVWYNLGLVHRDEAKYAEGVQDFKKVVSLDPRDADAHYFIGALYSQDQRYDLAVPEFEAALQLNRLHASAEFGLARALQHLGKMEAARQHLKNFEHLTRNKISSPMTTAYGEQGRYSVAEDVVTGQPATAAMIPVTFVPVPLAPPPPAQPTKRTPNAIGGGACLIDVDGDSRQDLVALGAAPAIQVYLNQGQGQFKPVPADRFGLSATGQAVSCAVGDFDNDGHPDLAVAFEDRIVLYRNEGGGKFVDATKTAGIEPRNQPAGVAFVDYDHDGDLDLYVTGRQLPATDKAKSAQGPAVLWRNNGNGTFTDWTEPTGLAGSAPSTEAALTDLNNDRAVDLLVSGAGPSPTFYANQREDRFAAAPLFTAALPPSVGIAVFDFNKDGWMDIAITHAGAPGVTLWKNVDGKRFERVSLPLEGAKQGWGVAPVDFDNDGWIDLAVVVETARGTELRILRNQGGEKFSDVSAAVGLDKLKLQNARSVLVADLDGDGDSDLVVTQLDSAPVVLRNDGGNRNHALRISLEGRVDNKSALGTKVEVFADGLWQKWEVTGASGYLGQGSSEILAGLGPETQVDVVRMLWPTGVLQDEIEVALDKPAIFTELDRRGSSCPTLFAWNGRKYEFVSDVIGAAVVGHWVSPREKNVADPDEWVKIEGSQLQSRNGTFSLRFGEPMEEVNFLDQLRLVAVDHPAGTEVYPNERFLSAPPFPRERTIVSSAPRPPAAWDDRGRDVMRELRARDHRYVRDFQNLSFTGFANMHALTLDLGRWSTSTPLRLYLHGFIEYFTATSMYAAWQAGINPIPPYVDAQLPDGTWKRVVDDMGFPAGLPRTIVVDLTGKLPPGTRRIRIGTNLQVYWDQVRVDNGPENRSARVTELPLTSAELAFRGYPQQVQLETPGDLTYVYDRISKTGPFARQRGSYTRYGDVTTLLKSVDDHYAIFGSGEEIDAEFSATPLPVLPAGWRRDYFFYANGFVKDMDFYEASPLTVAELPFHKMSGYPYPATEHYPDDAASVTYLLNWNDRFDSGNAGTTELRFQYRPQKP